MLKNKKYPSWTVTLFVKNASSRVSLLFHSVNFLEQTRCDVTRRAGFRSRQLTRPLFTCLQPPPRLWHPVPIAMSRSPSPSGRDEHEEVRSQNVESQQSQAETLNNSYPEPPVNVKSVPFGVLATLYENLQNERKPEKRRRLLANWFAVCNVTAIVFTPIHNSARFFKGWRKDVGMDLYPVLRLVLPQVRSLLRSSLNFFNCR